MELWTGRHRATGDRLGTLIVDLESVRLAGEGSLRELVALAPQLAERFDLVQVGPRGFPLFECEPSVDVTADDVRSWVDDIRALAASCEQTYDADYLAAFPDSPVSSVDDVIAFNARDEERYAPYGQGRLPDAAATSLTGEEYGELAGELRATARSHIDGLLEENDVETLVSLANTFSLAYAIAGYPAITVPAEPTTGLTFTGPYLSDGELIGYGYAFEQATGVRTAPPVGA